MKEKKPGNMGKFKGGRLRKGDDAVRLIEDGGEIEESKCKVVKIGRHKIVCAIKTAKAGLKKNVLTDIAFDRKTGIHSDGKKNGWLKNPPKPAVKKKNDDNEENAVCIQSIKNSRGVQDEVSLWDYCS
ncbi:MAG: hypothetical protein HGA36_00460 [Candidatus Moranbacteria bacterium]|nr:hypothetical protein [Candidatus Moranbacteria bacterium]